MSVRIRLLGEFAVDVDGERVPPEAWARRDVGALVKLLALFDGRLHRERVIEALWPGQPVSTGAPRLHKAAHYARRALGRSTALVLQHEMVTLLPDTEVTVDVRELLGAGGSAVAHGDTAEAERALALYAGELLPEDPFEPWTDEPRLAVQALRLDLLRLVERWAEVLEEEPADEQAHLALARAHADRGDHRAALRQFERLDRALAHELGTSPSPQAQRLRARLTAGDSGRTARPAGRERHRLIGRRPIADVVDDRLRRAEVGRGGTLVLRGPPGVGKSALLDLAESAARRRGWRSGRGSASAVEGPWPYAPVLEALGDLCRKHPALLDGLDDVYRNEIDRALSGRELSWSGESGHQRLFVATAELARLAASGRGLLIVVDDVHEADEASLRLLHYLARRAVVEPILLVLAQRPGAPARGLEVLDSMLARDPEARLDVPPLGEDATRRLVTTAYPDLPADAVDEVWQVSAGIAFIALEVARSRASGAPADVLPALPAAVLGTLRRVALLGTGFTTDEFLALADVGEAEAYRQLETAYSAVLVEPADVGHRFRHPLIRETLVDRMPASLRTAERREVGETLAGLGAPPNRVAHHLLAAGLPARAAPYVLQAAETAGALGAYRDALALVDAVRAHASREVLPRLLARRGDLLLALGDPSAVAAYQEALPHVTGTERRLVRARLARVASFHGDFDVAQDALAGLGPEGDRADGPILLARGNLAYFTGDIDTAWDVAGQAREMLAGSGDVWQVVDLITLQGLIAHQRGEWFERFRLEMRRTQGKERLAVALFDAHLCVAEYLLYGPVPYADVIEQAEDLRARATRAGALRGVAFATALIGEAALLSGDLDRAERELLEAVDLHGEIDASAGEAHSLQRLAEVRLARGDREAARELLDRALPLARWSEIGLHLLQRIYGTMIAAAPDPVAARAVVDLAEATLGDPDRCTFCDVMLAVPATIACADVGDVADAERHLRTATVSAQRWAGSAWRAAALEAEAHVAVASGRAAEAVELAERAAVLFESAGHPRDAERCRTGLVAVPIAPIA